MLGESTADRGAGHGTPNGTRRTLSGGGRTASPDGRTSAAGGRTSATAAGAGLPTLLPGAVLQTAGPGAAPVWRLLVVAVVTVFGLVFAGIGLRYVVAGRRIRRRARLETEEATAVADLSPGTALVSGRARPADDGRAALEAPITGSPALAATAEARGSRHYEGLAGHTYRVLAREDVAAPFVVDDGTGRVRVEPADPAVDVETETVVDALLGGYWGGHAVFWAPDGLPHADGLAGFHARTDDSDDDPFRELGPFVLGTASRYVEGTLRTGDAVWVHGTAVERDADRGEPRFAMTGGGDARLVVSDRSPADRAAPILRRGRKRYLTGVGLLVVGLVTAVGAWILL